MKSLFDVKEGDWDCGSIEDSHLIKMGDYYFITYATVPLHPGQYWTKPNHSRVTGDFFPEEAPWILRKNDTRTGLAITKDFKTIYRPGYLTDATIDDRDVIIFPERVNGKFVVLHRPMAWVGEEYGTEHPAMWISFCDDLLEHHKMQLLAKAEYEWEQCFWTWRILPKFYVEPRSRFLSLIRIMSAKVSIREFVSLAATL